MARFARAFTPEQYFDYAYGDAAYLSPEAYIQGTVKACTFIGFVALLPFRFSIL